jgi:hypothetical protein
MNSIVLPDYKNSILNITSSILKSYGINSRYSTLDLLDSVLEKRYKNVVLMIFDGMGIDILENNLPDDSFLRRNNRQHITSVFPCTTTAAMTAYYSGLSPNEHGWLGWSLYFKEFSRFVDIFTNQDSFTKTSIGGINVANKLMPYKTIFEKINEATDAKIKSYTIMPSAVDFYKYPNTHMKVDSSAQICSNIIKLCNDHDRKFIMSYWYEPDSTMHKVGCYTGETKTQMGLFNRQIEKMCSKLNDTLIIISADHGHINISREVFLNDIPEIGECLIMPPSIESRALSLFIKPEMQHTFIERFNKHFGDCFILYSKEEVIQNKLFGNGVSHKKIHDFLGDYLACATGNTMIRYKTLNSQVRQTYKGQHAGLTPQEMLVPLIMIDKK